MGYQAHLSWLPLRQRHQFQPPSQLQFPSLQVPTRRSALLLRQPLLRQPHRQLLLLKVHLLHMVRTFWISTTSTAPTTPTLALCLGLMTWLPLLSRLPILASISMTRRFLFSVSLTITNFFQCNRQGQLQQWPRLWAKHWRWCPG